MAIIEFLKDTDNNQQVLDIVADLRQKSQTDANCRQLLALILRGMEFLRRHGLPSGSKELFFTALREDQTPYTIRLVKELKHHPPLLEFRTNWQGAGAFSIRIFEFQHEEQKILVFSRAIVKQHTASADFEVLIAETEQILPDFHQFPERYINLKGDGVDE